MLVNFFLVHLHKSRQCSRSEPSNASRKKWSQLEQSIVNHPNFEKAAALVQLLHENPAAAKTNTNPHKIGSLPTGKAPLQPSLHAKTVQATVDAVKELLKQEEKEDEFEEITDQKDPPKVEKMAKSLPAEASVESEKPKIEPKNVKKKKPYVINIYLDTKQAKPLQDSDIKEKIKEFWYENMLEYEKTQRDTQPKTKEVKPVISAPILAPSATEVPQEEVEETVEEEEPPVKRSKSSRRTNKQEDLDEIEVEQETLDDVPKYQIEHVKKIYPDVTSTANPHTERLDGGTPPNYDLTQKIKEVVTSVSPISPAGFSKYLGMWRKMWSKKQDEKEQTVEENDLQTYTSQNVEDDQAKQAFRIIDNDKVFHMKKKMKFNPYDPQMKKYEEAEEDLVKSEGKNLEAPDVEQTTRKLRPKHQRRYYSSNCTEKILPDCSLNCRSKATTHLQITEYQDITNYQQKASYSTKTGSGNAGTKAPEKEPKTGQARVEEFVDKFKNALAVENKREFKKIEIVYDPNPHRKNKQQVKVEIVKADGAGSNFNNIQKKGGGEKRRGKTQSVKKSE